MNKLIILATILTITACTTKPKITPKQEVSNKVVVKPLKNIK